MTDSFLKFLKIGVVFLFLIALGMGGWFLYSRFFGKKGVTDSQITELEWWILWEKEEDARVLADAYESENPNARIIIRYNVPSGYKDKVIDQISDDDISTGPDIIRIHNTWLPLIEDYLSPLPSSIMASSDYSSTFYTVASDDFTGSGGGIYAIPIMFDGLGLYYNKELLREGGYTIPETTWDEFKQQAQNVTIYENQDDPSSNIVIAGVGMGTSNNVDFSFDILSLLMLQEGATMVDTSGETNFALDPSQRAAKAIKFYTDFANDMHVWDSTLARDITMFTEGRLVMMFAPSWRVFDIENALATKEATLDYDIAPVPQLPGNTVNWADYWGEAVSAESESPEAAWDFLKFISEKTQLESFSEKVTQNDYRLFGEISPRRDMADSLLSEKYVSAYIKMAETAKCWRMVDKDAVSEKFNLLITQLTSTGASSSTANIQGRLDTLAPEIDQILAGQ